LVCCLFGVFNFLFDFILFSYFSPHNWVFSSLTMVLSFFLFGFFSFFLCAFVLILSLQFFIFLLYFLYFRFSSLHYCYYTYIFALSYQICALILHSLLFSSCPRSSWCHFLLLLADLFVIFVILILFFCCFFTLYFCYNSFPHSPWCYPP
jgi:hypothetical protein